MMTSVKATLSHLVRPIIIRMMKMRMMMRMVTSMRTSYSIWLIIRKSEWEWPEVLLVGTRSPRYPH